MENHPNPIASKLIFCLCPRTYGKQEHNVWQWYRDISPNDQLYHRSAYDEITVMSPTYI